MKIHSWLAAAALVAVAAPAQADDWGYKAGWYVGFSDPENLTGVYAGPYRMKIVCLWKAAGLNRRLKPGLSRHVRFNCTNKLAAWKSAIPPPPPLLDAEKQEMEGRYFRPRTAHN